MSAPDVIIRLARPLPDGTVRAIGEAKDGQLHLLRISPEQAKLLDAGKGETLDIKAELSFDDEQILQIAENVLIGNRDGVAGVTGGIRILAAGVLLLAMMVNNRAGSDGSDA